MTTWTNQSNVSTSYFTNPELTYLQTIRLFNTNGITFNGMGKFNTYTTFEDRDQIYTKIVNPETGWAS